jgi:hypothetical protein
MFRNLRKSQRIRSRLGDSLDPFAPSPASLAACIGGLIGVFARRRERPNLCLVR